MGKPKTAIVTGASQGIGAGLVTAFLGRGYRVVANSRNISKTHSFRSNAGLLFVDGDIGKCETAARIAELAVSRFESIDVLVNNAGIFVPLTKGGLNAVTRSLAIEYAGQGAG